MDICFETGNEKFNYRVCAIMISAGKVLAMQDDRSPYYYLPGGRVAIGETAENAVIREVQEESGLIVIRDSIKPIGEVLEVRRDIYDPKVKYICHTYVYTCDVEDEMSETNMTESEIRDGYHLVWATLEDIISHNMKCHDKKWIIRDMKIMEKLQNYV